jgi:hypothetical protein
LDHKQYKPKTGRKVKQHKPFREEPSYPQDKRKVEEYRILLLLVDKVLKSYVQARTDLNYPLSAFTYDESKRATNRFLLCEFVADTDAAIKFSDLSDTNHETLVQMLIEVVQEPERSSISERNRQRLVYRLGSIFKKRRLDPKLWYTHVKTKIDWRKRLAGE